MVKSSSLLKRFWNYHDWDAAYVVPIFLGIPGGLGSYFALRKKNPKLAKKCLMLSIIFLPFIGGPVAYFAYKKDDPIFAKKYLMMGLLLTTIYMVIPILFLVIMSSSDDFNFLPSQIEIKTYRESTCNTDLGTFSNVYSNGPPVFVNKWSSFGKVGGQFNYAQDVAIDSQSNVYVTDIGTSNEIYGVHKFSSDGKFISEWGSTKNTEIGGIRYHTNIAIDNDDNVYVADRENYIIQKFTNDGQFITEWKTIRAYGINGLATDSFNNIYGLEVSSTGGTVRKWSSDGEMIATWYVPNYDEVKITNPADIAIDIFDQVYLLEGTEIHKLDCKGNYQTTINLAMPSSFRGIPQNVYVDSSGFIYITAFDAEHQILKFTNDGQFVTKWGSKGSGDGQFGSAGNIAIDSAGHIFVIDTEHDRIQKFI